MADKEKMDENQSSAESAAWAAMDRIIPKLCTSVQIALVNNKNVVLSMVYSEGVPQSALIERIVIDLDLAKKLSEILKEVVEKAT